MKSIIEVQNLTKDYPLSRKARKNGETSLHALKGVSFSVEKGEIFGILGPNGAGKTTTLEIIETIKTPTSGEVKVLGLDLLKDKQEIKKRIGVQLQSSNYLHGITLSELIQMFASLYNKTINPKELLGFVGLQEKSEAYVKELSGGQKQRFTVATSLVNEPDILFLDEPTTGLDPRARRDLWALIKTIKQKGITIVLTTHYMEEAEYLCDRVAIMDKGKLLTVANPKKLIDDLSHTTQVSFLTESPLEENFWQTISEVQKVYSQAPKIILEVSSLDSVGKIVELLKIKGIKFSGFTVKTATLEDVYLDLTGKEFLES